MLRSAVKVKSVDREGQHLPWTFTGERSCTVAVLVKSSSPPLRLMVADALTPRSPMFDAPGALVAVIALMPDAAKVPETPVASKSSAPRADQRTGKVNVAGAGDSYVCDGSRGRSSGVYCQYTGVQISNVVTAASSLAIVKLPAASKVATEPLAIPDREVQHSRLSTSLVTSLSTTTAPVVRMLTSVTPVKLSRSTVAVA